MAIKFKNEQQNVIDSKNKNVIVSASAGSGKTTVMIAKILKHIVEDGIKVKKLLVLTFTKASAEEMKQKLTVAMTEESKTNKDILLQLDDISTADISTIHKFFQKILKKYFNFVNLNPGFDILEDQGKTQLEKQAFDVALENFEKTFPNETNVILNVYSQRRSSEDVFKIVKKINEFLVSNDNPDAWCKENALYLFDDDLLKNKAVEYMQNEIKHLCDYSKKQFQDLQIQCANFGLTKYVEYINNYLSFISSLDFSKPESYFNYKTQFDDFERGRLNSNSKFSELYEKIKNLKDNFNELFQKCAFDFSSAETLKIIKNTKPIIKTFLNLTIAFQNEYEKIKKEKNLLDFNDLEKFALKLLDNQNIREEIKSKYDLIFIDEYQDTSRMQEKIISLLSQNNNRFMVGDVKQSIYGFRQAEPEIFLEKQDEYKQNSNQSQSLNLNYNFRSNRKILNFVNLIFEKIMTKHTAKVDYLNTSQMKTDVEFEEDANFPVVEIDIIKNKEKEKPEELSKVYSVLEDEQKQNTAKSFEKEATVIAQKIKSLLGKKIYIPSEKNFHEVEFKDISILLNKRGANFDKFCGTLQKFDIPIFSNTNELLLNDSSVQVLFNLIKICKSPKDDVALASVMHSEFGGFSYDELAQIRLAYPDEKYFYSAVEKSKETNEKIKNFYDFLQTTKNSFLFDGIYYTLNKLINQFDLNEKFGQIGVQKISIVNKFLQEIISSGFNFDFIGFIDYIENNIENIKAPNYVMGDNCVNVTTIHSSKGLEYPIVILANCGESIANEDTDTEVLIDSKLGLALKYYEDHTRSSNLMYEVVKCEKRRKSFADKLRLLYVALTRAKNNLIIVGSITEKTKFKKISEYEVLLQKNFLSLIVQTFDEQDIEDINSNKNIDNSLFVVKNISDSEINFNLDKKDEVIGNVVKKYQQNANKYFNYKYPYKTDISLKNSVTGLLKNVEEYTSFNPEPKVFNVKEHEVNTTPEIGIEYHLVLEKIDFEKINSKQDVEKFIQENFSDCVVDASVIFNCINEIKKLEYSKTLKEQKFVMKIKHNEIIKNGVCDNIIVQGVIDLLLIGKKNILIDYKYTNTQNPQKLIDRYKTQLKLYKIACEKMLNQPINEVFLMLIKSGKMLKIVDFD